MGDRYGYSIDIGKELEKEQELAKKQEEEKKQEQTPAQSPPEPPAGQEPETPAEQEPPEPAPAQPDALEEEVRAIVSNDVPFLRPKRTVLQYLEARHVLLFLLIIILFGAWSLQRPLGLAAVERQTEQSAEQQLQVAVAQKIRAEWDLLSQQEKARKAARLYAELRNSPETKAEITRLAAAGRELYEQHPGQPYLFGAEAYDMLGAVRDTTGSEGVPAAKAFSFFANTMKSLAGWQAERALTYAPVWLGIISLGLFFFAARSLTGSSFAGLLGALTLAVHPLFFTATAAGHATGASVALAVALLGVLALARIFNFSGKQRLAWLVIFAIAMWALSRVWNAWLVLPLVLVAHVLLYGTIASLRNARRGSKKAWLSCAFFVLLAAVFVLALVKTGTGSAVLTDLGVRAGEQSFYPQLPETGQSLSRALLGRHWTGMLVLLLAVGAFIALLMQALRAEKMRPESVFLLAWAMVSILLGAYAQGLHFFAVLPFLALVASAADRIAGLGQGIAGLFADNPQPVLARSLGCVLVGLVVLGAFWAPARAASFELPVANDAIAGIARHISQNSTQGTIIIAGQDDAAVWKALTRRQVLLDSDAAGPRLWWLSKAFTTSNEREARNILRLMGCGSDREVLDAAKEAYGMRSAHQLLANLVQSPVDDVQLVRPEGVAEINDTRCVPPQSFVVATEDLLAELPTMAAITEWDFSAGILPEANPDRVSSVQPCSPGKRVITCSGYRLNLSSLDAVSDQQHPAAVYLYGKGSRKSRVFDDAASPYALVAYEDDSRFRSFLVERELAESLLVRIIANDLTLKYFEPFALARQPGRVIAFSVAWQGRNITLQNVIPANATTSELSSLLAESLKD